MRVPRLAAHTRASTGAQPLRIETWGVSRMTASVPGRPYPTSGDPCRTKRPGAQSGLTALAAGDATSAISGSRIRGDIGAPSAPAERARADEPLEQRTDPLPAEGGRGCLALAPPSHPAPALGDQASG